MRIGPGYRDDWRGLVAEVTASHLPARRARITRGTTETRRLCPGEGHVRAQRERSEHEKGRPRIVHEHADGDRGAGAEERCPGGRERREPGVDPAPPARRHGN